MKRWKFAAAALLAAPLPAAQAVAQDTPKPPPPLMVWAAQPIPETPYTGPNRLIWRLSDILAAHKGQQSWTQTVALTRDFQGDYVSLAPGEKTKTMLYADDRVFWSVQRGQMKVNIMGRKPFTATKDFLVDVAPHMPFSIENPGKEPVVFFRVTPAHEIPMYPVGETPTPVKGWKFIKAKAAVTLGTKPDGTPITDGHDYDDGNRPYLDFDKDVVGKNAGSSYFVADGHTSAHIIRAKPGPTPPDSNFGHFHENMVELWIVLEGKVDVKVSGEKLVTGEVGDVMLAPEERWHRPSTLGDTPSTRLAITPRMQESQVHLYQPDSNAGN
jgi:mannose-6-phosphate isomerase-like protein (cupin superfamily)